MAMGLHLAIGLCVLTRKSPSERMLCAYCQKYREPRLCFVHKVRIHGLAASSQAPFVLMLAVYQVI